jgi:hypothetical protein
MTEVVVTLPADGSRTWTLYRKDSTRTGYGDDWRAHVAHYATETIVIDYSTASWTLAVDESVKGPMLKVGLTADEGTGPWDYVTPETKAHRASKTGATVTHLTAEEAGALPCLRCKRCNAPAFEWNGLRHHGATNVRTDNNNGKECPDA